VKEDQYYSLSEIPRISLQLEDVDKDQIYAVCSRSDDAAESGLQSERIQDKGETTKKFDSSRPTYSNYSTDTREYLERVGDADDQGAHESLEPVYDEQKEIKESRKPVADLSKESNPDYTYVNSGIRNSREGLKNAYEPLDFIHMQPAYEELNSSAMG